MVEKGKTVKEGKKGKEGKEVTKVTCARPPASTAADRMGAAPPTPKAVMKVNSPLRW